MSHDCPPRTSQGCWVTQGADCAGIAAAANGDVALIICSGPDPEETDQRQYAFKCTEQYHALQDRGDLPTARALCASPLLRSEGTRRSSGKIRRTRPKSPPRTAKSATMSPAITASPAQYWRTRGPVGCAGIVTATIAAVANRTRTAPSFTALDQSGSSLRLTGLTRIVHEAAAAPGSGAADLSA